MVLIRIDTLSGTKTQATCRLYQKPLTSAEKHNLQKNNWPYMQIHNKMEKVGAGVNQSMNKCQLCGKGSQVSPELENESSASGKVAQCNIKYVIIPDYSIKCSVVKVYPGESLFCRKLWCIKVLHAVLRLTWNKAPLHHLLVRPPSFVNFRWIRLCCEVKRRNTGTGTSITSISIQTRN